MPRYLEWIPKTPGECFQISNVPDLANGKELGDRKGVKGENRGVRLYVLEMLQQLSSPSLPPPS